MTKEDEQLVHRRRGRWIRLARERRGITLAALAEAMGYQDGQGTTSRWENGTRPVPSGKFPALAKMLGLPAIYLVTPPMTDDERLDAAVRDAEEQERLDWDREREARRSADDERGDGPGRRTA